MNILFYLKFTSQSASARVRGYQIAEILELKFKHNVKVISGDSFRNFRSVLLLLFSNDVIVFQKRFRIDDVLLACIARVFGKLIIFDLDDSPRGIRGWKIFELHAIMMMKIAQIVQVGSHVLLEFAHKYNDHTYLLPTSVQTDYYTLKTNYETDEVIIGWIGNGKQYENDLLEYIYPTIRNLSEKYKIKVKIVGAVGRVALHEQFGNIDNASAEIIDNVNWHDPRSGPNEIVTFDIGVYPLIDHSYNKYKCGFKILEYMASGIPCIASPVAENKYIIENSIDGYFANNIQEWQDVLENLIQSSTLRQKIGMAGYNKVQTTYNAYTVSNTLHTIINDFYH